MAFLFLAERRYDRKRLEYFSLHTLAVSGNHKEIERTLKRMEMDMPTS